MSDSDIYADLVAAVAARRDKQAFERLFDRFAPRVNAYLIRMGAEAAAAEELTQEVMVTLWRKADLFDRRKSSVATWLFRIARNRRIDMLRRSRAVEPLDSDDSLIADEDGPSPDESIDAERREELVRRTLSQLPEEQVRLVRLAFFDGLSHSEIAKKTGVPLGTVKSRIRLAFSRLKKALKAAGLVGFD